jgi:hypothetical protein
MISTSEASVSVPEEGSKVKVLRQFRFNVQSQMKSTVSSSVSVYALQGETSIVTYGARVASCCNRGASSVGAPLSVAATRNVSLALPASKTSCANRLEIARNASVTSGLSDSALVVRVLPYRP